MRWTRAARLTSAPICGRRSRVVLTPRRWRQVGGAIRRRRWQTSPVTGESPKETVNTIAQGNAGCIRWTCGDYARVLPTLRTRGCGCSGHPAFPAPSFSRRRILARPGRNPRRGNADVRLVTAKAPHFQSSSPAKAGDPVLRGLNDRTERPRRTGYPAFAGYDGSGWSGLGDVIARSESDEAIHLLTWRLWIGDCHPAALCADPLARNDVLLLAV
jgi:hypothetical protein